MRSSNPSETVVYTQRQINLIRDRLKAYYELQSRGPRRATWGGLCDEIFDLVDIQMDDEVLRQFAARVTRKSRPDKPRIPSAENLGAIVSFLSQEDVDVLSLEELEEPETPFLLARLFLESLYGREFGQISGPPPALDGVYQASHSSEQARKQVNLTLQVHHEAHVVHASETTKLESQEAGRPPIAAGIHESDGWGVVTPEGNLLIFMKKKPYGDNYYYLTLAANPELKTEFFPRNLAMFRHERPASCHPVTKTLGDLMQETKGGTLLLKFNKSQEISSG